MSSYPWGVSESSLPGNSKEDAAYERWFDERENDLLESFMELDDYGPVKDWPEQTKRAWDRFVERAWDKEK